MPPRRDGVKHARVVPCADVAACGERGEHLRFSMAIKWVTCRMCKVRRQQSIDRKRSRPGRIMGTGFGS
jgi:hypothetical protein